MGGVQTIVGTTDCASAVGQWTVRFVGEGGDEVATNFNVVSPNQIRFLPQVPVSK
jgi:hypothetical protein